MSSLKLVLGRKTFWAHNLTAGKSFTFGNIITIKYELSKHAQSAMTDVRLGHFDLIE